MEILIPEIDNCNLEVVTGLFLGLNGDFLIESLKITLIYYPILNLLIQNLKNLH